MGSGQQTIASSARHALGQWSQRLGKAGMLAMRNVPGLLAAVDQHAAQVRDSLADRRGRLHPISLAAYADGVADAATERGWSINDLFERDWTAASWPSVRLLAVCVLAETAV